MEEVMASVKCDVAKWSSFYCILASACVLAFTQAGCRHQASDKQEPTFELGNEIIAAIERYEERHGEYPEALEALVPDYLERVDATSWTYGGGGGVFQLYFSARLSGILTETWKYDSRKKKWSAVDESF
jgi:hypothetical protein